MGELWATMLPAAVAIALSPTGILELIMILLSARARLNALVFLASVMVGCSAAAARSLGAQRPRDRHTGRGDERRDGMGAHRVGRTADPFRRLQLLEAGRAAPPAVFEGITGMGTFAVFVLSLSVVWFNPINALVLLSVGSHAAATHVSTAALLPSWPHSRCWPQGRSSRWRRSWCGRKRAGATLDRIRQWILEHSRIVVAVALGLLGVVIVAQGVASLSG